MSIRYFDEFWDNMVVGTRRHWFMLPVVLMAGLALLIGLYAIALITHLLAFAVLLACVGGLIRRGRRFNRDPKPIENKISDRHGNIVDSYSPTQIMDDYYSSSRRD